MDSVRQIVIHPSLTRPRLFMDGEKRVVLSAMALCLLMAGASLCTAKFIYIFCGCYASFAMGYVSLYFARMLAKYDPIIYKVYTRNKRYKDYYTARPSVNFVRKDLVPRRWDIPKEGILG